jgi:phenylacetate-CoA ligase
MSIEDRFYAYAGVYKRLPDGLKSALTLPFRALPRSFYLGREYRSVLASALSMEFKSESEILDFQWRRMESLLAHCYDTVPYYARTWRELGIHPKDIHDFHDFSSLVPFVAREDVQNDPMSFISSAYPEKSRLPMNTGGSTGTPLALNYLKGFTRAAEWAHIHAYWRRFGHTPNAVMANLRGEFVGSNRAHSYDPWRRLLMLSSFELSDQTADQYLDLLARHRVQFLNAYPSSLHLLTQLSKRNSCPIPSLKGIVLASENILDWQVEAIERFFELKNVFWHYGHGEVAALGATCEVSRMYHFMPTYGYVEWGPGFADEVDAVEIVGTSFINPLMPLVRYRTQDYGIPESTQCACGRHHLQLKRVIGRAQELAIGTDGQAITLTALIFGRHAEYFNHIRQMQIVNTEPGRLIVRIVPKSTFGKSNECEVITMLSRDQGMPFTTTVEITDRIDSTARGKTPFLVRNFKWQP